MKRFINQCFAALTLLACSVTQVLAAGGNSATPIDRINVPEGFEVELLYSVPGKEQGSWVALCYDDNGRI